MATYNAGNSDGQPLEIIGTKTVIITNENLNKSSAHEGETVQYAAVVKDSEGIALPASFVADLEIDMVKVITGQVFDPAVYDPATCILTLPFTVPSGIPGSQTVKLAWAEQTI